MADVFDFYVLDNRRINFEIAEPIMREDKGVTDWVFHIPKILNGIDMSAWAWWLVYTNAKGQKRKEALILSDDPESPLDSSVGTYTVDYGMSIKAGSVQFALESVSAVVPGGEISGEWHTLTYKTTVKETLQGSEVEIEESQSDIISALIQQIQNKYNTLVGGATPLPVNLKSLMTDHDKVYLYTGSEDGESTGYWYYYNGTQFVPGGLYGAGVQIDTTLSQSGQAADANAVGNEIIDLKADLNQAIEDFAVPTQEAVDNWLDEHPEATTTVVNRSIGKNKLVSKLQSTINSLICNPEKIFREFLSIDSYCKIQGGCFIDNATVLYALSNTSPSNNNVKLVEVSLSNLSIVRSTVLELGHADDITYNPDTGELYVCPFYDYANAQTWTDLIVINYSDFTIKKTITLDVPAYGVAYDRATNKTYVRDNSLNLYEANLDSKKTTFVLTLPVATSQYVKQGIAAYNGFVSFSMYQPNAIYTIDVDDPSYINKASLPYITNDCYLYGEHEFFDVIGDDFIFGTNLIDFSGKYYQCNLWTNMPYRNRQKSYLDNPNIMYVDASSTAVCPNGNQSNAFATLEEASLCSQVYSNGDITFRLNDGTYSGQLRGNHYIQGVGTSKETVIINNLTVRYGMYRLYNLTLTGTMTVGENSFVYEAKCTAGDCDVIGYGMLVNYNPFKSVSCQNMSHAPTIYSTVAPLNNCGTITNYSSIVSLAQNAIDNNEYFVIKIYVSTSYGGIMNQGFAQLFVDKSMAEKLFSNGLDTNVLFLNGASTPVPFYCKLHCIIENGVFSINARGTDTFTIRSVQVGM